MELTYLRGQSLIHTESHNTRSQLHIEILKLFSSAILQTPKGSQAIRKHPSDLSKCSMIVLGMLFNAVIYSLFESRHLCLNESFDHLWILLYMREKKRLWHSNRAPFFVLSWAEHICLKARFDQNWMWD